MSYCTCLRSAPNRNHGRDAVGIGLSVPCAESGVRTRKAKESGGIKAGNYAIGNPALPRRGRPPHTSLCPLCCSEQIVMSRDPCVVCRSAPQAMRRIVKNTEAALDAYACK